MSVIESAEPYLNMADEYERTSALLGEPAAAPERSSVEITFTDETPPAARALVDGAYSVYTYAPVILAAMSVALLLHALWLLLVRWRRDCRRAPLEPVNIARRALKSAARASTQSKKTE